MYRTIKTAPNSKKLAPALAVVLFCEDKSLPAAYAHLDRQLNGALDAALKREEFNAEKGAILGVYPKEGCERLYLLGLGARAKCTTENLRIAGGALVKAADKAGITSLQVDLANLADTLEAPAATQALAEGTAIANHPFHDFKGALHAAGQKNHSKPKTLAVQLDSAALRRAFEVGLTVAAGVNVARSLAATPPNIANPAYLVDYCRTMSRKLGLKCTIIDDKKARQLGMGGLTAVGQAGSTPPAMICMEWEGSAGQSKSKGKSAKAGKTKPVLLVGKAITFDTGGYSLKISGSMLGMKYDKCGGMAVIGAMHAIASLQLPQRVVGIIAAAENMVDTAAYRPNDIITMYNGVSVEVTNTDAEGRLVLADALAYGCKTYDPRAVIDLATLTGGVVTALGPYCAGVFLTDDDLKNKLFEAARTSGEKLWELPLWDEHREQMKGTHSDIVNSSASRGAHPIQGAAFLSYFATPGGDALKVGQLPWAHIDIAGVADARNETPLFPVGPTGYGVRLLIAALQQGV